MAGVIYQKVGGARSAAKLCACALLKGNLLKCNTRTSSNLCIIIGMLCAHMNFCIIIIIYVYNVMSLEFKCVHNTHVFTCILQC